VAARFPMETDARSSLGKRGRELFDARYRYKRVRAARPDEDVGASEVRPGLGDERQHRAQQNRSREDTRVPEKQAGGDVRAVGEPDRDDAGFGQVVAFPRLGNECHELVRASCEIVQIERAIGIAGEKAPGLPFHHVSRGTEQGCPRRQSRADIDQRMLIAPCAVQEEQHGR